MNKIYKNYKTFKTYFSYQFAFITLAMVFSFNSTGTPRVFSITTANDKVKIMKNIIKNLSVILVTNAHSRRIFKRFSTNFKCSPISLTLDSIFSNTSFSFCSGGVELLKLVPSPPKLRFLLLRRELMFL